MAVKTPRGATALAIGNSGKLGDAATGGHAVGGHAARRDATGDCCDSCDQPRSHDTSRIAWATLMARVGEEFPLQCPACRLRFALREARPPTGKSSDKPTTTGHSSKRRIDELPVIEIHRL